MRLMLTAEVMQDSHKRAGVLAQLSKNRATSLGNLYKQRAGRPVRVAGQFQFPTEQVGATADGRVNLYYDPSLRQQGLAVANAILPKLDQLFSDDDAMFGVNGKAGNIIIAALPSANGVPATDGSTGAFHMGCAFNDDSPEASDWYEDVAFGNPDLTFGLVQAEVTESYMGLQAAGWDCGGSNGEALSRLLAQQVSGGPEGALADYKTGNWWAQAGFPNWIDVNEDTDRDAVSTGCGVVYLYWMLSQGFTATDIVQAGCPDGTLASNYKALTGQSNAWSQFKAAVDALPHRITGDDPWSAGGRNAEQLNGALTFTINPGAKTISAPAGYRLVQAAGARVMKQHGGG